ncbi:hypothetical protein GCM10017559_52540 [Streptosporangium longisporum]|uniref:Uncharacterized protein n=1 Tax=Streptosporangium longisporum TaxID=46187 RepID=A0ABN3YBS9_9ACTN
MDARPLGDQRDAEIAPPLLGEQVEHDLMDGGTDAGRAASGTTGGLLDCHSHTLMQNFLL